jgi:hypothetical protein
VPEVRDVPRATLAHLSAVPVLRVGDECRAVRYRREGFLLHVAVFFTGFVLRLKGAAFSLINIKSASGKTLLAVVS